MRILLSSYLYKPNVGGVENSIYHLSSAFKKHNHLPIIVASDYDQSNPETRLKPVEEINGIEVYRYKAVSKKNKLRPIINPILCVYRCKKLIKRLNKENTIDFHISRDYRNVVAHYKLFKTAIKCVYLIPSIFAELDSKFSTKRTGLLSFIRKSLIENQHIKLQKKAFSKCFENWVFSEKMVSLIKAYSIPIKKIKQVKPGVDKSLFHPVSNEEKLKFKTHLNINKDLYTCLCLGRFTSEKNFTIAIEAFKNLPENQFQLIIVGEGIEENNYNEVIKKENLTNVIIHSATNQPELYYKSSDLFLMTSLEESFGQTLLEAGASGLPILALQGDDVKTYTKKVIEDKGIYIPNSAQALSDKIKELSDTNDRNSLVEFITGKYNWENFIQIVKNYE